MTKELDFSVEHLVEASTREYQKVLDYCVGEAAKNRCGIRITHYSNGDLSIRPTKTVKFGTVEERHE